MISKEAVREFANRRLRDSRKAKLFTEEALDQKIADLTPTPSFKTPPRIHQKVSFLLGLLRARYFFLLDLGLGKTYLTLMLFDQLKREGKVKKGLILVPNSVNIQTWLREAKKQMPHLHVVGLEGNRGERKSVLDSEFDLIVCTYAGYLAFACERNTKKVQRKDLEKGKNLELEGVGQVRVEAVPPQGPVIVTRAGEQLEVKLNQLRQYTGEMVVTKKTDQIAKRFHFVGYDETSVYLQSHRSLSFRVFARFLKYAPYRFGLTGTPFGTEKNVESLWAQFYLVDAGETLGETLGLFRQAFFKESINHWTGWPEYTFDKRKKKQLHRVLRHGSIRYKESECNDLPRRVAIKHPIVWPEETWAYYRRLLDKLIAEKDDLGKRENLYIRLRQLCSGYLMAKGAQEEKVEIIFKENPKLDDLMATIHQLPPNRKIIVFHVYRKSGQLICDRLRKEKINHVWLYSGTKKSVKATLEDRINNDPKLRVVVSSEAGAYGGNWQGANYTLFFESPSDPKLRKQMEKRTHRSGQTRTCFVIDTFVQNSIEAKILKLLAQGKDLFEQVIEGKTSGLF